MKPYIVSTLATCLACINSNAIDISFTDVASDVGVNYLGETFGQAWGDFDRDGFVDLYASNHGAQPTVYKNVNGTSFVNYNDFVTADLDGDLHGAAWGDFDNDGDRDLLFVVGASGGNGNGPNRMLVNQNGQFVDQAQTLGLDYGEARGRSATWFDWNQDGLLDAGLSNWPRSPNTSPTAVFTQNNSVFTSENTNAGFNTSFSNNLMSLVNVNSTTEPVLLVQTVFGFPEGMFDMSGLPFIDITQPINLPSLVATRDFIAADLDGDLEQELFFVRFANVSEAVQKQPNDLWLHPRGQTGTQIGTTFVTDGIVSFNVGPSFEVALELIQLGFDGGSPTSLQFDLDPTDMSLWGTPPHDVAAEKLYIYYDNVAMRWRIEITDRLRPNLIVTSNNPITDIQTSGFSSESGARTPVVLKQGTSGYQDVTVQSGLTLSYACSSVAAADFDNDMDVDLYLACASGAINRDNILLENDGNGGFTEVVGAAGALGTPDGRSDVATVADYDNDGFIDILVSNGAGNRPFSLGPTELFKNSGNDNHWVHIDLIGISANRDGVGATVEVTSGGVVQTRLQNNGSIRFGQNDQRLHFGLGSNATIDEIKVRWPGGSEQLINTDSQSAIKLQRVDGAIAADQIITLTENLDSDNDGINDEFDNCQFIANPLQIDIDADGYGNLCDTDLNNDLITNFLDLTLFAEQFLSSDALTDFNSDGAVNFLDYTILTDFFLLPPGPIVGGSR